MLISDWSSDVCSSDLHGRTQHQRGAIRSNLKRNAQLPEHVDLVALTGFPCDFLQFAGGEGEGAFVAHNFPCRISSAAWPACQPHHMALIRSEEHTSELQSLMRISYAVFCLKTQKTKPQTKNRVS